MDIRLLTKDLPSDPGKAIVTIAQRVLKISPREISEEEGLIVRDFLLKFISKYSIEIEGSYQINEKPVRVAMQIANMINANRLKLFKKELEAEVDSLLADYESQVGERHLGLRASRTAKRRKSIGG